MAEGFKASYGSDLNNGLTPEHSKLTLQGASDVGLSPCYVSGYVDEYVNNSGRIFKGGVWNDKNYILGYRFKSVFSSIYDAYFVGWSEQTANMYNCLGKCNNFSSQNVHNSALDFSSIDANIGNNYFEQSTLYRGILQTNQYAHAITFSKSIICTEKVAIVIRDNDGFSANDFSVILKQPIKLTDTVTDLVEPTFETPSSILELKQRAVALSGGSINDYFVNTILHDGIVSDILEDADNGNFNLKNDAQNPAIGVGYNGENAGAGMLSVGKLYISDATRTNMDSLGNILDQESDANAAFITIQDSGAIREAESINVLADVAYRNGLSINKNTYIGAEVSSGSNVLTAGKVYEVLDRNETGSLITIDNASTLELSAFEHYTAIDEGGGAGLGFSGSLTMREVDIEGFNERIKFKSSDTDATLATANELLFLLNHKPMVNVDGAGIPIKGNGDDGYDELTAEPLFFRYWLAPEVTIKADQLYQR